MLSAWPWLLAMPSRPGPADAHDALAEGDAHADVVLVMPSRPGQLMPMMLSAWPWLLAMPSKPRPADAHDALAAGRAPAGHRWLMLMLTLFCGDSFQARAS